MIQDSIDDEMKRIADSGNHHLILHFINCTYQDKQSFSTFSILQKLIRRKMKKYGIQSSILTVMHMFRNFLITKEEEQHLYAEKYKNERIWLHMPGVRDDIQDWPRVEDKRFIGDDLELFWNKLKNKEEIEDELVVNLLLPKLTDEEMKLVAEKDQAHFNTYCAIHADVSNDVMKMSESKDKYVFTIGQRYTNQLSLGPNFTSSADEILQESFQYFIDYLLIN